VCDLVISKLRRLRIIKGCNARWKKKGRGLFQPNLNFNKNLLVASWWIDLRNSDAALGVGLCKLVYGALIS
jgi:hypothetical protein